MHSASLLRVFEKQKRQQGKKLKDMAARMTDDTDAGREGIIRGLCIFLNEDPDDLVQGYMDMTGAYTLSAIEGTTVGMSVARETPSSDDVGVIAKGVVVLRDLDNAALASAILFGLFYTLNLKCPPRLCYTFEIFQKNNNELDAAQL